MSYSQYLFRGTLILCLLSGSLSVGSNAISDQHHNLGCEEFTRYTLSLQPATADREILSKCGDLRRWRVDAGRLLLSRRGILGLGIVGILAAIVFAVTHQLMKKDAVEKPAPMPPPALASSDREIKDRIIGHLKTRNYFEAEIRAMFKRRIIPPSVARSAEELIEGVHNLVVFIDNARLIRAAAGSGVALEVISGKNEFVVSMRSLSNLLTFDEALFHEAIHLTKKAHIREKEGNALAARINRLWPYPYDVAVLEKTPRLQAAIRRTSELHGVDETEAYYGTLAMIRIKAGDMPMSTYLTTRLEPFAAEARMSVGDFIDEVSREPRFVDPVAALLVRLFAFAVQFQDDQVTSGFRNEVARSVLSETTVHFFLWQLSHLPPSQGGLKPGERFDDWAKRIIFPGDAHLVGGLILGPNIVNEKPVLQPSQPLNRSLEAA